MNYFPSQHQEEQCSTMDRDRSSTQAQQFPTGMGDDWTFPRATLDETILIPQPMTWPTYHDVNLLGIHGTTASFATPCHGLPSNSAYTWPMELAHPQPIVGLQLTDATPLSGDHNLPAIWTPALSWDPLQEESSSSAVTYDASPSLSEYSTSTRHSGRSSPYARSASHVRARGSPSIKLEEPLDRFTPRMLFTTQHTPLAQSMLVNPGDLVTSQSPMFEDHNASPIIPSRNAPAEFDDDNVEPRARARSRRPIDCEVEDVDDEMLDDRQKRAYTSPENAVCACARCGKLFQRSYNLKAHMETHDPYRSHPHLCSYSDCDKQFVRRTDLIRHEQSVRTQSQIQNG